MSKKPQTRHIPGQAWYTERSVNALMLQDGTEVLDGQDFSGLSILDEYARQLLRHDFTAPFSLSVDKRGRRIAKQNSDMAKFLPLLSCCTDVFHPDLEYAPHIQAVMGAYGHYGLQNLILGRPGMPVTDGLSEADFFNEFCSRVREEMLKNKVPAMTAAWDRKSTKNHLRVKRYVDRLLECTPLLSVVFLELKHRPGTGEIPAPAIEMYRNLQSDISRFFDGMRYDLDEYEHLLGHVWSLERSLLDIPRIKMVLFFDWWKVSHLSNLSDRLGAVWKSATAFNNGLYRVLKPKGPMGLDWVFAPVYNSWRARYDALLKRLGHMAMRERYCRFKDPMPGKSFGTGRMPVDPDLAESAGYWAAYRLRASRRLRG